MRENAHRILFLGEKGVGKSSLINLILHQKFVEPKETVIGSWLSPPKVSFVHENGLVKVELLDTNGNEYYKDFNTSLITSDIKGVFCVCDVINAESQRKAFEWANTVTNILSGIKCVILINKYDLKQNNNRSDFLNQQNNNSNEAKMKPIVKVSAKDPQKYPIEHALKLLIKDEIHPLVITKNKLFKFDPLKKETILHFCPFCKERIPKLNLFILKGELKVLIRCECRDNYCDIMNWDFYENFTKDVPFQRGICESNKKHQDLQFLAKSFCITCQKWLCDECLQIHDNKDNCNHKISSNKFILRDICRKHNESLYYCEICKKYECIECGKDNNQGSKDVVDGTFLTEINENKNNIVLKFTEIAEQSNFLRSSRGDSLFNDESMMNNKLANAITSLQKDLVSNSLYDIQIEKNFWNNFNLYKKFYDDLNNKNKIQNFRKKFIIDLNLSFELNPKIQVQLFEKKNENIFPLDIIEQNNQLTVILSNRIEIIEKNTLAILSTAPAKSAINKVIKECTVTAFCLLSNGSYAFGTSSKNSYVLRVTSVKGVIDGVTDKHTEEISCLCEAYDSEKKQQAILSGSYDGSVRIWSLRLECFGYLSAYHSNVNCISDLGDGLVAVSSDGKGIGIWKLSNKEGPIDSLPLTAIDSSPIKSIVQKKTEDIKILICAHGEGLVTVWEKEKEKIDLDAKFMAHQGFIYSMCVFKNTKLCTGGEDNYIKIWHLGFYALLAEYQLNGSVTVLRSLKDETFLAGTGDNYYYHFEFNN